MAAHIASSSGASASDYLSKEHRDERSGGCAYAALGSELARAAPEARGVVTAG